jgi:hypothetical protein
MRLSYSVLDARQCNRFPELKNMFSSRSKMAVRLPGHRPSRPSLSSRMQAALAFILIVPLFIVIVLALLLHDEWQVIVKEPFRGRDGKTRVRLVFNTRTRVNWNEVRNGNGLTGRQRLACFLLHTRLYELPYLFQSAFGNNDTKLPTSASISALIWRSLSSWAIECPRTNKGTDKKKPGMD